MQCKFLTLNIVPDLKTYKFEMAINFNNKKPKGLKQIATSIYITHILIK